MNILLQMILTSNISLLIVGGIICLLIYVAEGKEKIFNTITSTIPLYLLVNVAIVVMYYLLQYTKQG